MTLFKKLLVANRGEIACRIMKTCDKMGIPTVAVYSDADRHAKHVQMATEAYHIGPSPSNESYLCIDRIMEACTSLGVDAVHPGYGFLSEQQAFCKALEDHNIAFVGPNSSAITKMGDKIESKDIAKKAGVFTIPGFEGEIKSIEQAIQIANQITYPIMLKASAGGGGKGMRICHNDQDVKNVFDMTKAEAANAFNDDRLLVEKFIEHPRHIEIQLIGDQHGNTFYLPERECSIQRRNQKVIEEAPSLHITPEVRQQMGEQAVMLAKHVNYHSAGTVEFLVDPQRNFYFLEMNTRLQVEHPITEMITGLDLVEMMIRVAAKERLPLEQKNIKINGHAIESRVYAEDPTTYLPSIGTLTRYMEPLGGRCDSGIQEGSDISIYYDPMICKLCTHAETREEATDKMTRSLNAYVIEGVVHNIPLLQSVLHHEAWHSGKTSTDFLPNYFPNGYKIEPRMDILEWVACGVHLQREGIERASLVVNGKKIEASLRDGALNGKAFKWRLEHALVQYGEDVVQYKRPLPLGMQLQHMGVVYDMEVLTPMQYQLKTHMKEKVVEDTSHFLMAPMPGTVKNVHVKNGQVVKVGEPLMVLEAMKMQNVLNATMGGEIEEVVVQQGDTVAAEDVLLRFKK